MEACFLFWGFFLVRLGGYLVLLEPTALFSARVASCHRLRLRPLLVVLVLLLQHGGGAAAVSLCMCARQCVRAYLGALETGGGALVLTLCSTGGGPNSSKRMPDSCHVVSLPPLLVPQQQCVG